MAPWFRKWKEADVAPARPAALTRRTFLETADVRALLHEAGVLGVETACDVGCGYGRLSGVLQEVASRVVGFERDRHLAALARELNPDLEVRTVTGLDALPSPAGVFDAALVFTVLQHVPDDVVHRVAGEIRRIVRPGGIIIACEATTGRRGSERAARRGSRRAIPRPVPWYAAAFGLEPVVDRPRRVEPTARADETGTYMVFRNSA